MKKIIMMLLIATLLVADCDTNTPIEVVTVQSVTPVEEVITKGRRNCCVFLQCL